MFKDLDGSFSVKICPCEENLEFFVNEVFPALDCLRDVLSPS